MSAIRGKHARSTERALRMALIRAGIRGWQLHPSGIPGKPDIYFPKQKTAIFVDGCFWHGCPKCGHIPKTRSNFWAAKIRGNQGRDRANTRRLRESEMAVLRIWEHSLIDAVRINHVLDKIRAALARSKSAIPPTCPQPSGRVMIGAVRTFSISPRVAQTSAKEKSMRRISRRVQSRSHEATVRTSSLLQPIASVRSPKQIAQTEEEI
jgi:DNA mismatch endonuclease (patch repair protein)